MDALYAPRMDHNSSDHQSSYRAPASPKIGEDRRGWLGESGQCVLDE